MCFPLPCECRSPLPTLPEAVPPLAAPPDLPAATAPPLAEPLTVPPLVPAPADVPEVVLVFWDAEVLWLVVALGLMVTLLCGIALKFASVLVVVVALGLTAWPAVVLVLLLARLLPLPLPPPAVVPLVVAVFCDPDVVWLVVALGLMVTLLWGIALKFASVLVVVVALGATAWPAVVLVLLPLELVCASAAPLMTAKTAAAMTVNCVRIIRNLLVK